MRNLALAETTVYTLGDLNSGTVTSTVLDTDDGSLWVASERLNEDADVVVDMWKVDVIGSDDQVRLFISCCGPTPLNAPPFSFYF